jgi:hypothetical protein
MKDPRYAMWLEVADELESLHAFSYGPNGPFSHIKGDELCASSGLAVAKSIRNKCAKGGWYWWDSGWLGGKAVEPLHSFDRVIGDGALDSPDKAAQKRQLIERIDQIKQLIVTIGKQ